MSRVNDIRAIRETLSMHGLVLGEMVKAIARAEGEDVSLRMRVERTMGIVAGSNPPTDH